jgi:hypothetical protein
MRRDNGAKPNDVSVGFSIGVLFLVLVSVGISIGFL